MFLCKTPYRVSFFGGGSDYPKWFNKHSGEVIGSSIDKYFYLVIKKLSSKPLSYNYKFKITWNDISYHLKLNNIGNRSFQKILFYFFSKDLFLLGTVNFDFTCLSDISSGSGMGSSSAFTITLLNSLYRVFSIKKSKVELIQEAVFVEQVILNESVGCQDQVLACFGGLNVVKFYKNNSFKVLKFINHKKITSLNNHSYLFNTGCVRLSSNIASSYLKNVNFNESKIKMYRSLLKKCLHTLCSSTNKNVLLCKFSKLLHDSWLIKRSLISSITNPEIDTMYEKALRGGNVTGGKLLGAGGGGFLFLLSKARNDSVLRKNLGSYKELSFNFSSEGAQCAKV